jgi:hypothetical protein
MLPVSPYKAVSSFEFKLLSFFIMDMQSCKQFTKTYQLSWLASVIAKWAPGGFWSFEICQLCFLLINSQIAMAFTVGDENEIIGL